jgi:hypothetical protein
MRVKDYPMDWIRRIDFLTPLYLQVRVEKDLPLKYIKAVASIREGRPMPTKDIKTELGTVIKAQSEKRREVICEIGVSDHLSDFQPITQREWLKDITEYMPDVLESGTEIPDVVIKERLVEEPIKKIQIKEDELNAKTYELINAKEKIFYYQTSSSSRIHNIRRTLGIKQIANYYDIAKDFILTEKILDERKFTKLFSKKIRSVLKTNWIVVEDIGWNVLGRIGVFSLEKAITHYKGWTDIGRPVQFQIPVDSGITGQVYSLLRRKQWIVV